MPCLTSNVNSRPPSKPKPKKPERKTKERIKVAQQVVKVSPPFGEGERTPISENPGLVFYENDSEGEDAPMINGSISSMTPKVKIFLPSSGLKETLTALLGSGCTRCVISLPTVKNSWAAV